MKLISNISVSCSTIQYSAVPHCTIYYSQFKPKGGIIESKRIKQAIISFPPVHVACLFAYCSIRLCHIAVIVDSPHSFSYCLLHPPHSPPLTFSPLLLKSITTIICELLPLSTSSILSCSTIAGGDLDYHCVCAFRLDPETSA